MAQVASENAQAAERLKSCRCVILAGSHLSRPQRLLDGLSRRGLHPQVVADEPGVMLALSVTDGENDPGPRMLILDGPPRHARDTELVAAVRQRFPHAVIWRHVENGGGLVPFDPPAKDAEEAAEPSEVDDENGATVSQAELAMLLGEGLGDRLHEDAPPPPALPPSLIEHGDVTGRLPTSSEFSLIEHLLGRSRVSKSDALAVVEERSGITGLKFVKDTDAALHDGASVPVAHAGSVFGLLVADENTPVELLAPWAAWLGRWFNLSERFAVATTEATTDYLTGVSNRRYFDRRLEELVSLAIDQRFYVTLLMFDIDHFKAYNDRFGHAAGDEILREAAKLMQSVTRPHDVVARVGGDEFSVIFWDADEPRKPNSRHPDDVVAAAARFQKAVREHRFPKLAEQAADSLTVSAGLASLPWDGRSAAELMACADRRLIESKEQGRNVLMLGPEIDAEG